MAKNTFKEPPVAEKKPRRPAEGKQLRIQWGEQLKSREFQLAWGGFLVILSMFLVIALSSYLFTGAADQSVVKSAFNSPYKHSSNETRNFFGLFGAMLSHLLVFRLFGIMAFLFVPLLFLAGSKVILRKELISISRFTWQVLFVLG